MDPAVTLNHLDPVLTIPNNAKTMHAWPAALLDGVQKIYPLFWRTKDSNLVILECQGWFEIGFRLVSIIAIDFLFLTDLFQRGCRLLDFDSLSVSCIFSSSSSSVCVAMLLVSQAFPVIEPPLGIGV